MNLDTDPLNDLGDLVTMNEAITLVARGPIEALYLPAELLRAVHTTWTPERSVALLDRVRRYVGTPRPTVAAARAGRNGPCPCGSGRKHKRCCGA